jgi:hypothetical protein
MRTCLKNIRSLSVERREGEREEVRQGGRKKVVGTMRESRQEREEGEEGRQRERQRRQQDKKEGRGTRREEGR